MFRKMTLAVLLAISGAAGATMIAVPASAVETQAGMQNISALLSQHPDGGSALEAALAGLIANAEDPAAMAADIILSFGVSGANDGQLAALGSAINGITAISPAALQAAIAAAVASASEPVAAAQYVLDEAPYLALPHQDAAGHGIAMAVAEIGILKPDAAASILAKVDVSNLPTIKMAFAEQQSTTASINSQSSGRNILTDRRDNGNKTTSPN